jgi:hypothetical protein
VAALLTVLPLETPEAERFVSLEKSEPEKIASSEVAAEEPPLHQLDSVVLPLLLPAPLPRPAPPNLWTFGSPRPPVPPWVPVRAPLRGRLLGCLLRGTATWDLPPDESSVSMLLAAAWRLEVPGWLESLPGCGVQRRLSTWRCGLEVPARVRVDACGTLHRQQPWGFRRVLGRGTSVGRETYQGLAKNIFQIPLFCPDKIAIGEVCNPFDYLFRKRSGMHASYCISREGKQPITRELVNAPSWVLRAIKKS